MNGNKELLNLNEIKRKTNEFILEQINKNYKNNEENVLCELLSAMGYETKIIKSRAGEKDIIASKPGTSLNILLQLQEAFSDDDLEENQRSLFNLDNNYDVLVTLSNCGENNDNYAKEMKVNKVLGGKEVISLVLKYYSKMSDDFKTKVPLKSIWIPGDWKTEDNDSSNIF